MGDRLDRCGKLSIMIDDTRPYRYLNDNGAWPRFHWHNLALGADGALRLPGLPALAGPASSAPAVAAPPAGLAVDADGTVYFTDPASDTLWQIVGCSKAVEPAACIGGALRRPSGLALGVHRHALYIANAGAGSVQIVDLSSMALAEVLDGFINPVSLALDEEGTLYVADRGAGRVEVVSASGDWLPAFGDMVQASGQANDPGALAWEAGIVYVLDCSSGALSVFAPDRPLEVVATGIAGACVFAVVDAVLYVADPARRRIAVWQRDQAGIYQYVGAAAGHEGAVCALAADRTGALLAAPGADNPPLRLRLGASHASAGWLWSDAIVFGKLPHAWNRLKAAIDLPAGSHVRFYVHAGALAAPPPPPADDGVFDAPWRALPGDLTDFFIDLAGRPAEALWLGAHFGNDLDATPVLWQARLAYDQSSYLPALPPIYRPGPGDGNFLQRYLSLFESFFDELETAIDDLPGMLDPAAAPAAALPWLAGFLALDLPEAQDGPAQRAAIAGAFARYGRRGTVAGLRAALQDEAGVRALIDEPLQAMGWWSLPVPTPAGATGWVDGDDAILGLNTVLAQAEYQGAVLGTTATLDHAHLLTAEDFGAPLFEAAAGRFLVRLYPGQLHCAGKLEQVRAIIERDKPAHTLYDVCTIESGLRVGFQATLGVDTLLGGGPAAPAPLGEGALVLGGPVRGRLGIDSRVGAGAQL